MAQLAAILGDVKGNVDRVVSTMESKSGAVDMVIFPELFITGYALHEEEVPKIMALCEDADGPVFQTISAAARRLRMGVVYGFGELLEDKRWDGRDGDGEFGGNWQQKTAGKQCMCT